ncbi:family 20 glycosylhydrolase [Coprobacter sp.]
MKKYLLSIVLIFLIAATAFNASAQYNLIPQPRKITKKSEHWIKPKKISTEIIQDTYPEHLKEAYWIDISKKVISIKAYSQTGLIWAKRTLQQLISDKGLYPEIKIFDYPEFDIRGFMYDCGRNFIEVDLIKNYIDLISRYKLNVFHWHLTDKPAWRIECKVYPELNNPKFQRIGRDEGKFYTYNEIREVISYAKERGIMIIPEIDMPGHSDFFDATFGCSMNSAKGMAILEKCLLEFFNEIPVTDIPYLHIGSDEVHINNPKEFMTWAETLVRNNGRKTIAWYPGLEGDSQTLYQVWNDGSANNKKNNGTKKILDSFMGYLNYSDPIIFTNKMFLHTPCHTGCRSNTEIGGILCLWNDVRVTDNSKIALHSGMMGGVLPYAERFWNGGKITESDTGILPVNNCNAMKQLENFQNKMIYHKVHYLQKELAYWQPNRPTLWDIELYDENQNFISKVKAYGDVIDLEALCHYYQLKNVTEIKAARKIYADEETICNARIGFDAAARSNRISDGIALQGKWENYGDVKINGEAILPPVWEQPGLYKYHYNTWAKPEEELPYTDEQFYWTRKAVSIKLNKGENIIELSTKKHFTGQKFQFAFLIDMEF